MTVIDYYVERYVNAAMMGNPIEPKETNQVNVTWFEKEKPKTGQYEQELLKIAE